MRKSYDSYLFDPSKSRFGPNQRWPSISKGKMLCFDIPRSDVPDFGVDLR